MQPIPFTRTARLLDYPDCCSVADWQQRLALDAHAWWLGAPCIEQAGSTCCYNWGGASFRAPGRNPRYYDFTSARASSHEPADPLAAVFALSVLDRVASPLHFLRQQHAQLLPGGLLVASFAYWDACGEDVAVGHEVRRRIYDHESWHGLMFDAKKVGFTLLGGADMRYHGPLLGDHTLATLVVRKNGEPDV